MGRKPRKSGTEWTKTDINKLKSLAKKNVDTDRIFYYIVAANSSKKGEPVKENQMLGYRFTFNKDSISFKNDFTAVFLFQGVKKFFCILIH